LGGAGVAEEHRPQSCEITLAGEAVDRPLARLLHGAPDVPLPQERGVERLAELCRRGVFDEEVVAEVGSTPRDRKAEARPLLRRALETIRVPGPTRADSQLLFHTTNGGCFHRSFNTCSSVSGPSARTTAESDG